MKYLLSFILLLPQLAFAQLTLVWNSSQINYNTLSGFVDFKKNGDDWEKRIYQLDSTSFRIMTTGYSLTTEFTYTFNQNEILGGLNLYSLGEDLNGNGIMDFYVSSLYGSVNRQAIKIFDISTGETILERNESNSYFSYPELLDVNNDDLNELIIYKFDFPFFEGYTYEIYTTTTTGLSESSTPKGFKLYPNFPNPFNPSTTLKFNLDTESRVQIKIFDIKGELMKTLIRDLTPAGENEIIWDGTNDTGYRLPSGVYVYQVEAGTNIDSRKMILLK